MPVAPNLVWQDVGDLLDPNYLQTLKAGERERERGGGERERLVFAYESLVISKKKMLLMRIGFCKTKSAIGQY